MKIKAFSVLALIVLFVICFLSCVSRSKESDDKILVLTPETTIIKGDLGDYYEVVDKEYPITDYWEDNVISIEVKRKDTDFNFNVNGCESYGVSDLGVTGHAGFGIEILDEDGNIIDKVASTAFGLCGMYSSEDMTEALNLKHGETSTIKWSFTFDEDNKPIKFRLTSAYEEVDSSSWNLSTSDSDSDSYESSVSRSEDLEIALNLYDSYVAKFIYYTKKAADGDLNALLKCPSLMQNVRDLALEMQSAQKDMSASQFSRFIKITNKFVDLSSAL